MASLKIVPLLRTRGLSGELIMKTARMLGLLQDDEPTRPSRVRTMFHPLSNVINRNSQENKEIAAWSLARTHTIFLEGANGLFIEVSALQCWSSRALDETAIGLAIVLFLDVCEFKISDL